MLQHLFVGKIGDASVDKELKALNVASMNSTNRCLNQTDHISKEHEEDHQLRMKTVLFLLFLFPVKNQILDVGRISLIEHVQFHGIFDHVYRAQLRGSREDHYFKLKMKSHCLF